MPIKKIVAAALVAAAAGPAAFAEGLLPDHVRLAAAADGLAPADPAGPAGLAGLPTWLTARATDLGHSDYLGEATADDGALSAAKPAGPWAASRMPAGPAPLPAGPDTAEPGALIEALNALGPVGVNVADYLTLALPGLFTGPVMAAGQQAPAAADRARSSALPMLSQPMNFLPNDNGLAPAAPATGPRKRWTLPANLSEQLTRYLFGAAAMALVAGAGLRLARQMRHGGAQQPMPRL